MAVAMLYPEPEKGGRGKKRSVETVKSLNSLDSQDSFKTLLANARTMIRECGRDAENVDILRPPKKAGLFLLGQSSPVLPRYAAAFHIYSGGLYATL